MHFGNWFSFASNERQTNTDCDSQLALATSDEVILRLLYDYECELQSIVK